MSESVEGARGQLPRRGSSWRASGWSLLEFGAGPIAALIATPILLKTLGQTEFGRLAFLLALTGLGGVVNFGAANAATQMVASAWNDPSDARQFVRSSLALSTFAALLAFAIFVAYLATVKLGAVAPGPQGILLMLAAASLFSIQQFDQVLTGSFKGMSLFAEIAAIELTSRCALAVATCLGAVLLHSAFGASCFQALSLAIIFLWKNYVLCKKMGSRFPIAASMARKPMQEVFRYSKWPWLQGISSTAFNAGDRVILGAFLGPTALASYAICIQVGQIIQTISIAVFQRLMPRAAYLVRVSDMEELRAEALRAWKANLCATLFIGVVFFSLARPVVSDWLGADFFVANRIPLYVVVSSFLILSLSSANHFLLLGMGSPKIVAVLNLIGGGALLVGLLPLSLRFGVAGAGAARVIYGLIVLLSYVTLHRQISKLVIGASPRTRRNG